MVKKTNPGAQANLKELAYQRLKVMLVEGGLPAGKPLVERDLSRELGVSRTPIKHALSMLEQERLVRIVPRKGIYPQKLTYPEYQNMLAVREVLEGLAARLAVDHVANVHLQHLHRLLEQSSDQPADGRASHEAYALANVEFHRAILELSHNPTLIDTVRGLYDHLSLVRLRTIEISGRRRRSIREHQEIMAALDQRDPDRAEAVMRTHIRSLREDIQEEIRLNPDHLTKFGQELTSPGESGLGAVPWSGGLLKDSAG